MKLISSKKGQNEMKNIVIKNIIITILLFIVPISLGWLFSFLVVSILPGYPGFANLGISITVSPGTPVIELLNQWIPANLEYTIIPIVLGLIVGVFLGISSVKVRSKVVKVLIQIFVILGLSMPMFLIGMLFQYAFAFQLKLYFLAIGNPFLPGCIVFLTTMFLTTRQVRSNYLKNSEEKNIIAYNLQITMNLGILITNIFLLEVIFNMKGFLELFFRAIVNLDYWLIQACVFVLIELSVLVLFISNIIYIIYNHFSDKSQSPIFAKYFGKTERIIEEGASYDLNQDQKFKDFILYRLKSPLTIFGLVVVVISIIIALFPQILTPYSMQEAMDSFPGPWSPPSATHPLGKTAFGRDVLALLAYGISTSIKVCIITVLIGFVIGVLFGYLTKVHNLIKELVLVFMVIILIVPSIVLILIYSRIFGKNIIVTIILMVICIIPGITLLVGKGSYSLMLTAKKIVVYFPLFMAIIILLFETVSFLGLILPSQVYLGLSISEAKTRLTQAPWASLWPSFAIYVLVIGFLSLHYGLKEPIPVVRRVLPKRIAKETGNFEKEE